MEINLTDRQKELTNDFYAFIEEYVVPYADQWDSAEETPKELFNLLAQKGYLGASVESQFGGLGYDKVSFGLLCEAIGAGSASLLSLLTVHGMVTRVLEKWGSALQQQRWLKKLSKGEIIGAFALTEPEIGSDARNIMTKISRTEKGYVISGWKKWISYACKADLFLIFGELDGDVSAFLVEKDTPGLTVTPMSGLLGFRAAMIGELVFDGCQIPAENLVGREGVGFNWIANTALDHGRFCVAWGCLGLSQACLDASLYYSNVRKQGGGLLRNHQFIQKMIADMVTGIKAARLMCYHSAYLKDIGEPESIMETSIAKYFTSKLANACAYDAVQIHGGHGCGSEYPVQRYFRDARIMEIIEGSSQIQQIIISKSAYQDFIRDQYDKKRRKKNDNT